MRGNKSFLKTFRGRKFRQRRAKSVHRKMALPCILNKTAAAFSIQQYISNYMLQNFQSLSDRIQNDMHHIPSVLQFTLGQSVIGLLLAPPVPI